MVDWRQTEFHNILNSKVEQLPRCVYVFRKGLYLYVPLERHSFHFIFSSR